MALGDSGATSFYSDLEVVDFFGLNDVEFASEGFSVARLLKRDPDYVVLKSGSEQSFKGTLSIYGVYSDMIFRNEVFTRRYRPARVFVSRVPFYCLWVFERR